MTTAPSDMTDTDDGALALRQERLINPLTILPAASLPTLLQAEGAADLLKDIAAKVAAFHADASTEKGRAAIRTMAHEIASAKATLDKAGLRLTETWRKSTTAVNAERKLMAARMEELQERVREPLTAYETAEKNRVAAHEAGLADIIALGAIPSGSTAEQIGERLDQLEDSPLWARDWQEFTSRAQDSAQEVREALRRAHAAAVQAEADARELEELRAARAQAERLTAEREAIARAEQERIKAEEAIRMAAETARKAAEAEAERQARIAAEALAKAEERATRLEQEREEAVAEATRKEQARVAAEKAAADQAAEARAKNRAHQAKVNSEALADLMLISQGITETLAKDVIKAMALGKIRNVRINY